MKAIKKIMLVLISIALFTGCSNENYVNCDQTLAVGVEDVVGPATATINQIIPLEVTFVVGSNCGEFLSFDEITTATNEKTITVMTKYEGCACNLIAITKTVNYSFSAATAGTYVLKFTITNNTFKTITVVVT